MTSIQSVHSESLVLQQLSRHHVLQSSYVFLHVQWDVHMSSQLSQGGLHPRLDVDVFLGMKRQYRRKQRLVEGTFRVDVRVISLALQYAYIKITTEINKIQEMKCVRESERERKIYMCIHREKHH